MTTTMARAGAALAAVGLLTGMLSACTPESDSPTVPTPTKTALFASDEEAFAAAEKTYRAYRDAMNAEYRGDAEANADAYLVGAALEDSVSGQRQLEEMGYSLQGEVPILEFLPDNSSIVADRSRLEATICLDLTKSRVVLSNGEDADLPDRPDRTASHVEMSWVGETFMISREGEGDVEKCDG